MALTIGHSSDLLRIYSRLNQLESERSVTLARLATGKRINRGADDPAGLIAYNGLQSEIASVDAALSNNQRTQSLLNVADSSLSQVSTLVNEIQGLAVASVGDTATAEEKAANQAQIDSALDAIDRIVNQTTFNGKQVFGGANQIVATPSDSAALTDVHVHNRHPGETSTTLSVTVASIASAATTKNTSVANLASNLSAQTTISIGGKNGTATITLASGSTKSQVVAAVNDQTGVTGVSAVASGNQLVLYSTDKGSDAFVSISKIEGDADFSSLSPAYGEDAVIRVNGQSTLVSGTEFSYSGGGLSLSANLANNTAGTYSITISGGGATFQLGTRTNDRKTLGFDALNTGVLGRSDLGYLTNLRSGGSASIVNDANTAALIAKEAASQVVVANARIGGFVRYQVDPTINMLNATKEALTSAASDIGDTDYAMESARLERQNLLTNATLSLLSVFNNNQSSMLSLLR